VPRWRNTGPDYNIERPGPIEWKRLKQAFVCKATFVGAPMIYYGTEAGMWGADDPSDRQPMIWQDLMPYDDPRIVFHDELFAWYQKLIAVRGALSPLRRGFFYTLLADDETGVLVYGRDSGEDHVYVALNRSADRRVITISLDQADWDRPLLNWLDTQHALLLTGGEDDPDARPTVRATEAPLRADASGHLAIELEPYGSAIISAPPLASQSLPSIAPPGGRQSPGNADGFSEGDTR